MKVKTICISDFFLNDIKSIVQDHLLPLNSVLMFYFS